MGSIKQGPEARCSLDDAAFKGRPAGNNGVRFIRVLRKSFVGKYCLTKLFLFYNI